jgi:hypothetical protein
MRLTFIKLGVGRVGAPLSCRARAWHALSEAKVGKGEREEGAEVQCSQCTQV